MNKTFWIQINAMKIIQHSYMIENGKAGSVKVFQRVTFEKGPIMSWFGRRFFPGWRKERVWFI